MATFTLKLDKRVPLKKDKYNLSVIMVNGKDVMYLKIVPITEKQFDSVFVKKANDLESAEFRDECQKFLSKCETTFAKMKPFNKPRFRELVYEKEKEETNTLLLKDLFKKYMEDNESIKLKTKDHYRTTMNVLETFKTGITVFDVTPKMLLRFEKYKMKNGCSRATISSYLRHLRSIINYYSNVEKLIPTNYIYPFGKGGYSVNDHYTSKLVLTNEEIKTVAEFKDFEGDTKLEYARDIWLFLYRCNGINFADLLRMRQNNIKGEYFIFPRMKTEFTKKNGNKDITSPITPHIQELIDKVGVKDSPFILGLLEDGYADNTFRNKKSKVRKLINANLKILSEKLNLSVQLKLKTARDSYATTLLRAGVSKDNIGAMLGHSNSIVTERYLGTLDIEKTKDINDCLF